MAVGDLLPVGVVVVCSRQAPRRRLDVSTAGCRPTWSRAVESVGRQDVSRAWVGGGRPPHGVPSASSTLEISAASSALSLVDSPSRMAGQDVPVRRARCETAPPPRRCTGPTHTVFGIPMLANAPHRQRNRCSRGATEANDASPQAVRVCSTFARRHFCKSRRPPVRPAFHRPLLLPSGGHMTAPVALRLSGTSDRESSRLSEHPMWVAHQAPMPAYAREDLAAGSVSHCGQLGRRMPGATAHDAASTLYLQPRKTFEDRLRKKYRSKFIVVQPGHSSASTCVHSHTSPIHLLAAP